jgi:hypothetical protein
MRALYVISIVALLLGALAGMSALDARDATLAAEANNAALRAETQKLEAEGALLRKLDPWPLLYSADALSELFSRTVEAGEVLGAGVRIESRNAMGGIMAPMTFTDFRQGVQVCPVTLSAAMEGEQAPAILAMFEEELGNLPAAVRRVTARKVNRDVALSMDIDVFGRTP